MNSDQPERPPTRQRTALFVELSVLVVLGAMAYVYVARARSTTAQAEAPRPPRVEHAVGSTVPAAHPMDVAALRSRPHIMFRSLQNGNSYGVLAFAPLNEPGAGRETTGLACDRAYEVDNTILCLAGIEPPQRTAPAYFLDGTLTVRHAVKALGKPSRVRLSRDGRLAAYTVFSTADSYMTRGFSTRTRVLDVESGSIVGDLERFTASKDGTDFRSVDFNYWGVTFARDDGFFATLGTKGHTYLVKGDLAAKQVKVIQDGIECPSLSPDERRIAFKKKLADGTWRPAILDLSTHKELVLPETRNVDDQIEWLDDRHVLYALARDPQGGRRQADIWVLAAHGTGTPTLLIPDAESPAVSR